VKKPIKGGYIDERSIYGQTLATSETNLGSVLGTSFCKRDWRRDVGQGKIQTLHETRLRLPHRIFPRLCDRQRQSAGFENDDDVRGSSPWYAAHGNGFAPRICGEIRHHKRRARSDRAV